MVLVIFQPSVFSRLRFSAPHVAPSVEVARKPKGRPPWPSIYPDTAAASLPVPPPEMLKVLFAYQPPTTHI
jgi:hypothetical protein